uniref:Uncharacterized protein n=1 Tax=Spongospora subterranea TaxID=70186 RepID=A0A0H5RC77_9EUKA|eukprot:CRZ11643.1 hypothetical protein [Spongospora subterranea]
MVTFAHQQRRNSSLRGLMMVLCIDEQNISVEFRLESSPIDSVDRRRFLFFLNPFRELSDPNDGLDGQDKSRIILAEAENFGTRFAIVVGRCMGMRQIFCILQQFGVFYSQSLEQQQHRYRWDVGLD